MKCIGIMNNLSNDLWNIELLTEEEGDSDIFTEDTLNLQSILAIMKTIKNFNWLNVSMVNMYNCMQCIVPNFVGSR